MHVSMSVENANDINVTLHITMPLYRWRELAKDLPNKYPQLDLALAIRAAVNEVEKTFVPESGTVEVRK